MNLIHEVRGAVVAKLRTAWGIAGSLIMFVSPLASLAFRGHVPPEVAAFLPYAVLLSVASLLLLIWLASYAWHAAFGTPEHVIVPELDTVIYATFPYQADSHLRALSSFAHKVFQGDTMPADIVQHAVASRCAVGVRLTDRSGKDAGFFDVFRLRKESLRLWLDGRLSEPELKDTDFEPLARAPENETVLELIVGGIYIEPAIAKEEPSLVFQLAELAESYLWKACPGWEEIRLYSSIFSAQGERLASLYGFSKSIYKQHRHGAGVNHDVWVRTLRRNDPPRVVRGLGGRHNVILEMRTA